MDEPAAHISLDRGVNGAVVAQILPAWEISGPFSENSALQNSHQSAVVLATCEGDDQMCGVLRAGSNVLELHRTDHNESASLGTRRRGQGRQSFWVNVLNLSLKSASAAGDGHIAISACHLLFLHKQLVVAAVGREGADTCLFVGSLQLPMHASSSFNKETPLRVALSRRVVCGERVTSACFAGSSCAVVMRSAIVVVDLCAPPGCDPEVLRLPAASLSFGQSGSWEDSAVAIETSAGRATSLYVYRNHSPALLKFPLPLLAET